VGEFDTDCRILQQTVEEEARRGCDLRPFHVRIRGTARLGQHLGRLWKAALKPTTVLDTHQASSGSGSEAQP
jgi:hypothetical protein